MRRPGLILFQNSRPLLEFSFLKFRELSQPQHTRAPGLNVAKRLLINCLICELVVVYPFDILKTFVENDDVRRAAIAILQYLRDHPQAKDSLSGIAEWWVGQDQVTVETALKFLAKAGVLQKRRHLYRLASHKAASSETEVIAQTLRRLQGNDDRVI